MSNPTFTITTSWDDGHSLDLRLADLLDRYGQKGTFYIARDYLPERLTEPQIRELSARHEIGAHTLTHPVLTDISPERAREEIAGSRTWLMDALGADVTSFCYPKGYANPALQTLVRESGYRAARGVEAYQLSPGNPYLMATTVHVYPFPLRPVKGLRHMRARLLPLTRALPHLRPLELSPLALRSWRSLALALLERAAACGGVYHVWGHSWEVEQYGMWDDLEAVLKAARAYPNARRVTNSELV
jgi:peptidoglycan-N-acetylglucosamine deacetylase